MFKTLSHLSSEKDTTVREACIESLRLPENLRSDRLCSGLWGPGRFLPVQSLSWLTRAVGQQLARPGEEEEVSCTVSRAGHITGATLHCQEDPGVKAAEYRT